MAPSRADTGPCAQSTVAAVLRAAGERLAAAGIGTARLDAEVLLRHVLGISRTELFVRYPDPIAPDDVHAFDRLLDRRLGGQPVAYLTGAREFMGLPFRVGPGVLIPRPETELLVEWALDALVRAPSGPVVDVGTGSGAIAVSIAALAAATVVATVVATDVSPAALEMAQANADAILDLEGRARIQFRAGSLLEPLDAPVAMVLANLPYLTPGQVAGNPDLAAEPVLALDGGSDGLDLVRALVADLPRVLAPGGGVGLELDPDQAATVERLLRDAYPGRRVRTIRDLAGLDRHVVMEPGSGA